MFLRLVLVLFCWTASTSGQSPPSFYRQNGKIHAALPGFPGLTAVTMTISGTNTLRTAPLIKAAVDGNWKTSFPDVTDAGSNVVNYVIQYKVKDYMHETKGSTRLANEAQKVAVPVTKRYLQRRTTVVFHDDFTSGSIDSTKWTHEITGFGGGANQVVMYSPEPANSYIKHNMLYIKPTPTVDHFGDDFLTHGDLDVNAIWGKCVNVDNRGCHITNPALIPPIMSARLKTKSSIRYGKITVNARLPKGDWLWPAIWLLPTEYHYGPWPKSGEIDILESRGNIHYHQRWGHHESMGTDYAHSAIHYGSHYDSSHRRQHEGEFRISGTTFADSFHNWWMDWTADYIKIGVDDHTILAWDTPSSGYWQESHLQGDNVWASGTKAAPFDRPFYLMLNVAVGGGWFWEQMVNAAYPQPWHSNATKAQQYAQFWNARHLWQPTWHGENAAMRVKFVTMEQY